jgi:hypothetical protein
MSQQRSVMSIRVNLKSPLRLPSGEQAFVGHGQPSHKWTPGRPSGTASPATMIETPGHPSGTYGYQAFGHRQSSLLLGHQAMPCHGRGGGHEAWEGLWTLPCKFPPCSYSEFDRSDLAAIYIGWRRERTALPGMGVRGHNQ